MLNTMFRFFNFSILFVFLMPLSGHGAEFIWGTEGRGMMISNYSSIPKEIKNIAWQINDVLGVHYVKVRLRVPMDDEFISGYAPKRMSTTVATTMPAVVRMLTTTIWTRQRNYSRPINGA